MLTKEKIDNTFAKDVLKGLSAQPKFLQSKYFYDQKGDKIFQEIMNMEEYYLTNAEYDIFTNYKADLLNLFSKDVEKFRIIEFGAGDGLKTKVLLEHFLNKNANFEYVPIDISENVLKHLVSDLENRFPKLKVHSIRNDYFHALDHLHDDDRDETVRNVIFFLGSNIGNFKKEEAVDFLKEIGLRIGKQDFLFLGTDLKKDPKIILNAYNDASGITKRFNLNLLERINRELGANFDLNKFMHYPVYDPQTGTCKSYLISLEDQVVEIADLNDKIEFEAYEAIHTEISQKYSVSELKEIAQKAGFGMTHQFYDERKYFLDSVWELS
ncbi:L-histidine N(alpha)-methyltransferase [Flexithrix dorotheae]|uniref:L-histidine N(alpha)-methyltransferase n=1 Tax=Flexithrix dorotheae TaxID=70993 RepID=UPI00036BD789|nr:L-histidine N(alpha)-methyltransferase [Flexithrix dorotheae]